MQLLGWTVDEDFCTHRGQDGLLFVLYYELVGGVICERRMCVILKDVEHLEQRLSALLFE